MGKTRCNAGVVQNNKSGQKTHAHTNKNAFRNREPVKLLKEECAALMTWCLKNKNTECRMQILS